MISARRLNVVVLLIVLVLADPHAQQFSGVRRSAAASSEDASRVWRSGGTPERARRGKCWIDGVCAAGDGRHRSSRDDDEDAYWQLKVGVDEDACLARAEAHYALCKNFPHQRVRAMFVPTGAFAYYPPTRGEEEVEAAAAMIRALRQSECLIRDGYSTDGTTNRCFAADGCAAHLSAGAGGSHWAMNRLIGWRDFEVLAPEVDVLLRAGFCLNQDALYKWAAVMHAIRFLLDCSSPAPPKEGLHCQELLLDFGPNAPTEHSGLGLGGKLRSVDIGAGSAPLQHWAAQFGPVTAIDINFQSSWFPIDNQGFFVGADKLVLPPRFANLSQVEGDLLAVLGAIPDASLDLVYDACSLIHMFPHFPTPADGLRAAMAQVHRVLRPGGVFIAVSDVAHPSASEVREFLHPERLAELLQFDGEFEWLSPPDFSYGDPENLRRFGDNAKCRRLASADDKATSWNAPLETSNLHTCEELPEGTLRILIASYALRKPVDA